MKLDNVDNVYNVVVPNITILHGQSPRNEDDDPTSPTQDPDIMSHKDGRGRLNDHLPSPFAPYKQVVIQTYQDKLKSQLMNIHATVLNQKSQAET